MRYSERDIGRVTQDLVNERVGERKMAAVGIPEYNKNILYFVKVISFVNVVIIEVAMEISQYFLPLIFKFCHFKMSHNLLYDSQVARGYNENGKFIQAVK